MSSTLTITRRPLDEPSILDSDDLVLSMYDISFVVRLTLEEDFTWHPAPWLQTLVHVFTMAVTPDTDTVRIFDELTREEWSAFVSFAPDWQGTWEELVDVARLFAATEQVLA